jgi:site-specific recombinase XerD
MITEGGLERDLAALVVPQSGRLVVTGDRYEPYQLIDPGGAVVGPVTAYFRDLLAAGRSELTVRSYGFDLVRWFRFCWAAGVGWDRATRIEARDFCRWLQVTGKQPRPHWRTPGQSPAAGTAVAAGAYAPSVRAHTETVLRGFYDFHLQAGSGPVINPFPLARRGRGGRPHAHHNPMEPYRHERAGRYRPQVASRVPRSVPDSDFNEIFAALPSHRDRALVAFYVSTGARASELLSATLGGVEPGRQLITVVRKGTRALQQLPASTDAFVWLRLYQVQMRDRVPAGRDQPLWWTLRRPYRALTYDAARLMFTRANAALGANWSLHDLRHSAAYRMARDPDMPLTDIQWVLGHAHLSTTQQYLTPLTEDVIASVLAFHGRQREPGSGVSPPAAGYRAESLKNLFGEEAP